MYGNDFRAWLIKKISFTFGVAISLAILIFLIGSDIANRSVAIVKQRQELSLHLQSLESIAALRSDADRADKISDYLKNLLPTQDQLIGFSKTLEKFAKSNQLGFGFSFGSEVPAAGQEPGVNNFLLTAKGAYPNFLSFLKAVEASNYFVSFDYFELNKKDKDFEILMRGKVFSQ